MRRHRAAVSVRTGSTGRSLISEGHTLSLQRRFVYDPFALQSL